jgi:hypothetical protein
MKSDAEFLLGEAVTLLKALDDHLVVDCLRLNNIELDPALEALVYQAREFVRSHAQFGNDYVEWERIRERRSTQEYLDWIKSKNAKKKANEQRR